MTEFTVDGVAAHAKLEKLESELAEAKAALAKISEIRDSIVGGQCFNWSERITAVESSLAAARALHFEEAARHVAAHSCVASCCDAQPSGGEATALANCIRHLAPRPAGLVAVEAETWRLVKEALEEDAKPEPQDPSTAQWDEPGDFEKQEIYNAEWRRRAALKAAALAAIAKATP